MVNHIFPNAKTKLQMPNIKYFTNKTNEKNPSVKLYSETDTLVKNPLDNYGQRNFQPLVTFFFGRRGQGKTLAMTALAYLMHERYKKAGLYNHKVLTNYATNFSEFTPYLIDEMIQFPTWLKDGTVCIDEVGSAFPSVRAMSTINVLFTNMLTQLRKRKLEISFTTQFPQMISYGVLTQVDLFILCEKIAGGRAVKLYIFDHWGQWTGNTWKKNFPQPKWEADWVKTIHHTDKMWGAYNTEEVIASLQSDSRSDIIDSQYDFNEKLNSQVQIEPTNSENPVDQLIEIIASKEERIDPVGLLNQIKEMDEPYKSEITKQSDLEPYLLKQGFSLKKINNKTWGIRNVT
tara:strand:- start:522 stop:1559 length:1038 start_codon:yes stop_codon:yes gene_type:complete